MNKKKWIFHEHKKKAKLGLLETLYLFRNLCSFKEIESSTKQKKVSFFLTSANKFTKYAMCALLRLIWRNEAVMEK